MSDDTIGRETPQESTDQFIADCFQRDEGCRHSVKGVNLDVCSVCVREVFAEHQSATPPAGAGEARKAALREALSRLRDKWVTYRSQEPRLFDAGDRIDARTVEQENTLMTCFIDDLSVLLSWPQEPLSGVELIALERKRQLDAEGWTPRHDADHCNGELVAAAICYAEAGSGFNLEISPRDEDRPTLWPFESASWRPSDDLTRNLVKAGALIAAEIDRLQREAADDEPHVPPPPSPEHPS